MATKTNQVENFARSAMAPLMSATVMIAKVSWKPAKRTSGMKTSAPKTSMTGMPSAPTVPVTPSTVLATPRRPNLSKGLARTPPMSDPPKDIE